MCITLYDFVHVGDSHLLPGDADSYTPVEFRYIVFQPFRGEILQGTIAGGSRADGLRVSLTFFSDIIISPDKLPKISFLYVQFYHISTEKLLTFSDDNEQVWYWEFVQEAEPDENNEAGASAPAEPVKFYMERGATIRQVFA